MEDWDKNVIFILPKKNVMFMKNKKYEKFINTKWLIEQIYRGKGFLVWNEN